MMGDKFDKAATTIVEKLADFGEMITPRGEHRPPAWVTEAVGKLAAVVDGPKRN
jgi:hypothetical protein